MGRFLSTFGKPNGPNTHSSTKYASREVKLAQGTVACRISSVNITTTPTRPTTTTKLTRKTPRLTHPPTKPSVGKKWSSRQWRKYTLILDPSSCSLSQIRHLVTKLWHQWTLDATWYDLSLHNNIINKFWNWNCCFGIIFFPTGPYPRFKEISFYFSFWWHYYWNFGLLTVASLGRQVYSTFLICG